MVMSATVVVEAADLNQEEEEQRLNNLYLRPWRPWLALYGLRLRPKPNADQVKLQSILAQANCR